MPFVVVVRRAFYDRPAGFLDMKMRVDNLVGVGLCLLESPRHLNHRGWLAFRNQLIVLPKKGAERLAFTAIWPQQRSQSTEQCLDSMRLPFVQ